MNGIELPLPQHVAAVTLGVAGGTKFVLFTAVWYCSYYWCCVINLVLRSFAIACLRGWK